MNGERFWRGYQFCQRGVQLALRDLIRPGSTCIDGGVYHGWFSIVMSRLVGLRGQVYAIEANPEAVAVALSNFAASGQANLMLVHRALWSRSGEMLVLSQGAGGPGASSLRLGAAAEKTFAVESVSLDDFCQEIQIQPNIIKLDIEGCELDALTGTSRLLEKIRPMLILEQQTEDRRCIRFLQERRYEFVELETYKTGADNILLDRETIRNVLAIPAEKLSNTPYADFRVDLEPVLSMNFSVSTQSGWEASGQLTPGRYLASFAIERNTVPHAIAMTIADGYGAVLAGAEAEQSLFGNEVRVHPFHVSHTGPVTVRLSTIGGTADDTQMIRSTVVIRCVRGAFSPRSVLF